MVEYKKWLTKEFLNQRCDIALLKLVSMVILFKFI